MNGIRSSAPNRSVLVEVADELFLDFRFGLRSLATTTGRTGRVLTTRVGLLCSLELVLLDLSCELDELLGFFVALPPVTTEVLGDVAELRFEALDRHVVFTVPRHEDVFGLHVGRHEEQAVTFLVSLALDGTDVLHFFLCEIDGAFLYVFFQFTFVAEQVDLHVLDCFVFTGGEVFERGRVRFLGVQSHCTDDVWYAVFWIWLVGARHDSELDVVFGVDGEQSVGDCFRDFRFRQDVFDFCGIKRNVHVRYRDLFPY